MEHFSSEDAAAEELLEVDAAEQLLLKDIGDVGDVDDDLSNEDKLEDIFKEMLESAEDSPKVDDTPNIATVANLQQQQQQEANQDVQQQPEATVDWTTEIQPINISDYRRLWEESVSSADNNDEDDEKEDEEEDDEEDEEDEDEEDENGAARAPEVYHLNRPGRGKQLPLNMRSSPEEDDDEEEQKEAEKEEEDAVIPSKRARGNDTVAAADSSINAHWDELPSSSTQIKPTYKTTPAIKVKMDEASLKTALECARATQIPDSSDMKLRQFKKIPVFLADYHNHVLVFIYRAIAMRFLPLNDNVLIHFDSHPDMVVNNMLDVQTCLSKQQLLEELSIEDWIMPGCYTGQFGRIIWLKNSWAKQIDVGHYEFMIGNIEDKLGVDIPHNYFLAEGSYYPTHKLANARQIKLDVCEMDTQHVDSANLLLKAEDEKRCILDIDLDYFSTNNPFLDLYPLANCYAQLKKIFEYHISDDYNETAERRRQQLAALKLIFEHLQAKRTLSGRCEQQDVHLPAQTVARIAKLVKSLYEHYEEASIDFVLVYNAGCTTDNDGLPHHPSTPVELEQHYRRFKYFLEHMSFPPICVTIACSVADSYTPSDQLDAILQRVLQILGEVWGDKINTEPIRYDGTESFNLLKL